MAVLLLLWAPQRRGPLRWGRRTRWEPRWLPWRRFAKYCDSLFWQRFSEYCEAYSAWLKKARSRAREARRWRQDQRRVELKQKKQYCHLVQRGSLNYSVAEICSEAQKTLGLREAMRLQRLEEETPRLSTYRYRLSCWRRSRRRRRAGWAKGF